MPITPTPVNVVHYRRTVERLGTKTEVAKQLGVARELLSRRCHGHTDIDREAYLALRWVKNCYFPIRRRREQKKLLAHPCFLR